MPTYDVARIDLGGGRFHVVRFERRIDIQGLEANALIERAVRALGTPVLLVDRDGRWYGEDGLVQAMKRYEPSTLPWLPRHME